MAKSKTQKLNDNFKSNPTALAFHDVNQDGLADLVVLIPYEKVKVLLQVAGKDFEELDVAPPGGAIEQPWLSTAADVDGDGKPELLLPQKNFLRAVVLKTEPAAPNSTNKRRLAFQREGPDQRRGQQFAHRRRRRRAERHERRALALPAGRGAQGADACASATAGVWQVVRNLELPVSEFSSLQSVALGGKPANSVAFLGLNAVAWLPLAGEVWEFTGTRRLRNAHQGRPFERRGLRRLEQRRAQGPRVFLETAKNYLDLVIFDANHKLVPANRWQVFEERTFRSRRSDMPEPREAVVADVTGDGKNDLIVLVHDRILVYPQECHKPR